MDWTIAQSVPRVISDWVLVISDGLREKCAEIAQFGGDGCAEIEGLGGGNGEKGKSGLIGLINIIGLIRLVRLTRLSRAFEPSARGR